MISRGKKNNINKTDGKPLSTTTNTLKPNPTHKQTKKKFHTKTFFQHIVAFVAWRFSKSPTFLEVKIPPAGTSSGTSGTSSKKSKQTHNNKKKHTEKSASTVRGLNANWGETCAIANSSDEPSSLKLKRGERVRWERIVVREERKLRWKKDSWKLNVLRRAPIAADNSDNGAATPWGVFSLLFSLFVW